MGSQVIRIIHNLELFIAFRLIGSPPRIIDMILNTKLFIAFGGLRSRDIESFISFTTMSCS